MDTNTSPTTPTKKLSRNPLGRAAAIPSRRKFQEAIKALKGILRVNSHPAAVKIRASEILCALYGISIDGSVSKRDLMTVRDLVTEKTFEKQLAVQVGKRMAEIYQQETERAEQERADEMRRQVFNAALGDLGSGMDE